jgi:hypothetical protein
MEHVIEYKGKMYYYKNTSNILEKMFLDKCWFIVKNIDIDTPESYADLWICVKYYGVEYSNDIMEKLKLYEKNLISTI